MSSFYYYKPHENEPKLAVKCDLCGAALFTDCEGQDFPEHITIVARAAGWAHKKEIRKWKDYCPDCVSYMRQKIREIKQNRRVDDDQR